MIPMIRGMLLMAGILAVSFADDFSAWSHSAGIQINTTPEWAGFSGTATDFPLLVRLDSAVFDFSEAKTHGEDIRFTKDDSTTPLFFDTESWEPSLGHAAFWVLIDTIKGNSSKQIRMFWGNPQAANAALSSAVFDTARGYLGVWHLGDPTESTTNQDATAMQAHGTREPSASAIPVVGTPLGTGQFYNATTEFNHTEIPAGAVDMRNRSLTVSAWIKRNGLGAGDFFLAQGTKDPLIGMRFGFDYQSRFTFNFLEGFGVDVYTRPTQTQQWHYWVGTFDNDTKTISIYCDGNLDTSGTVLSAFNGSDALTFCWAYGLSGETLHASGSMDEVRITSRPRPPEWIALEYANQRKDQALVGNPVPEDCVPDFGVVQNTLSITEGSTPTLTGRAKCSERFRWVRLDNSIETPCESDGVTLRPSTRVNGNSTVTYRFKALYGAEWQSADVDVQIQEAIAEPEFTLNLPTTTDGSDLTTPLVITPAVTNLAEIEASSSPTINYEWTVDGIENFTMKNDDTLTVYLLSGNGQLNVRLCVDNGGDPVCREATTDVTGLSSPRSQPAGNKGLSMRSNGRFLQLRMAFPTSGNVRLFSLAGEVVLSRRFSGNGNCFVAVPGLPAGTYLAEATVEGLGTVRMILLQRHSSLSTKD